MLNEIEIIEEKVNIIKETSEIFEVTLKIQDEAMHYMKAFHSNYDAYKSIILCLISDVKHKNKLVANLTLEYLLKELKSKTLDLISISITKENEAYNFLNQIEKSIISIKDNSEIIKSKISIEEVALEMKNKGFIETNATKNIKQFLYKDIHRLESFLDDLLSNGIYNDEWRNTRKLLVFKKMIIS